MKKINQNFQNSTDDRFKLSMLQDWQEETNNNDDSANINDGETNTEVSLLLALPNKLTFFL